MTHHNGAAVARVQPERDRGPVRVWRCIAAVLALTQLGAPLVADTMAGDFLESGPTNEAAITPSGYAFGIWAVICVLSVLTTVAVLYFGLGAAWEVEVLVDASIVFVGFSAWLTVAAQQWLWASVGTFAVMVAALTHIMVLLVRRAEEMRCPRPVAVLATVTFGCYLGWSSIAVFVNAAAALINRGWPVTELGWQAGILAVALGAAIFLTVVLRATPGYVAGALRALVGAAVGAAERDFAGLAAAAAAAGALVLITAMITATRQLRASVR